MSAERRLLLLSNGHGEDAIACALAGPLRAEGFALEALPIVGTGGAYARHGVPCIGPARAMPSGGFVYGRPAALAQDLAGGLVALTRAQIAALRAERGRFDGVVAVGDIVVLLFAWLTGRPFVFVGCAKSDYYLHGRPGAYLWHERLLLRHPRCRGVFPRDQVTTDNLARMGIAARYLGNPMMDDLAPSGRPLPGSGSPTVLLVPGSRQEAYANFGQLREAARAFRDRAPAGLAPDGPRFLAAIAPGLPLAAFAAAPGSHGPGEAGGWNLECHGDAPTLRHRDGTAIALVEGAFADAAHAADLAFATAGTATEQLVGLGKPVLTLPGPGPQFTAAFAEAQTRLLGESVACLPDPLALAMAAWTIWQDPDRRARMARNGLERMGLPGASARLARAIATLV